MERGFDKLMTPAGVGLVTAAMFLFFVAIAAGGVAWSLMARAGRERRRVETEAKENMGP